MQAKLEHAARRNELVPRVPPERYVQSYNFFPGLPAVLRLLSLLPLPLPLLGALFSCACFLTALTLLRRIYPDHGNGLLLLAFFPTSFFFTCVYTESLYLLLASVYVALLRRRRPWLAFVAGAVCGVTRINGILIACLALDELRRPRPARALPALAGPAAGLAAWASYLWSATGDPLKFLHAQVAFARSTHFDIRSLAANLSSVLLHPSLNTLFELVSFLGCITGAWVLAVGERRPGAALFLAGVGLMPLFTVRLLSMNRYVLVAFPLFLLLGSRVKSRRLLTLLLAGEGALGLVLAVRFGHHLFVG